MHISFTWVDWKVKLREIENYTLGHYTQQSYIITYTGDDTASGIEPPTVQRHNTTLAKHTYRVENQQAAKRWLNCVLNCILCVHQLIHH